MTDIAQALQQIKRSVTSWDQREPLPFEEFLQLLAANPERIVRNVFQVFHDMIVSYVGERPMSTLTTLNRSTTSTMTAIDFLSRMPTTLFSPTGCLPTA